MADLNGAYYGPAIPPTQKYHSHGRGSGCGGCCLLNFLFKIILTLVILAGIAILVFWLVVRPNRIKFHVTNATLTEFNHSDSNMINYNLSLDITVRNPNKRIGIYYDTIEARAYYGDERLESIYLPKFYLGHKSSNLMTAAFSGTKMVVLGSNEIEDYNKEKANGVYNFDVNLYLRIRLKLGDLKTGRFKPKVKCGFKVPLMENSTGGGDAFEISRCDVDLNVDLSFH